MKHAHHPSRRIAGMAASGTALALVLMTGTANAQDLSLIHI